MAGCERHTLHLVGAGNYNQPTSSTALTQTREWHAPPPAPHRLVLTGLVVGRVSLHHALQLGPDGTSHRLIGVHVNELKAEVLVVSHLHNHGIQPAAQQRVDVVPARALASLLAESVAEVAPLDACTAAAMSKTKARGGCCSQMGPMYQVKAGSRLTC